VVGKDQGTPHLSALVARTGLFCAYRPALRVPASSARTGLLVWGGEGRDQGPVRSLGAIRSGLSGLSGTGRSGLSDTGRSGLSTVALRYSKG